MLIVLRLKTRRCIHISLHRFTSVGVTLAGFQFNEGRPLRMSSSNEYTLSSFIKDWRDEHPGVDVLLVLLAPAEREGGRTNTKHQHTSAGGR
eukprot:COSAG02_NODE_11022_length_1810_cov_1.565167_3_plen_92_part_00